MYPRIFFDTAPFIYFLDRSPVYYRTMRDFFYSCGQDGCRLYTSIVSDMEYSVIPYRNGDIEKVRAYRDFLALLDFTKTDLTAETADTAAALRGKYRSLKGLDAMQIASCMLCGCDVFVTNDARLRQITETKILLVEELRSGSADIG